MSTTFLTAQFKPGGVLTNATTAVLSDATGTYGIKRNDTDAVVVADGAALVNTSTGVYTYSFTDPGAGLTYTYALEFVYAGITSRATGQLTGGTSVSEDVDTDSGARNLYATVAAVKADQGIVVTTHDARIEQLIEAASRECDAFCHRHFYVWQGIRYFNSRACSELIIDDLLSVSALTADSEEDGTFDGETWTLDVDYHLQPDNEWPKCRLILGKAGNYSFADSRRYLKITGMWGYGDGRSATPYVPAGVTGSVGTTTGETLSISAGGVLAQGHTILIGTEQMYVRAVSDGVATVARGVNGTTAATHSTEAVYIYQYPAQLVRFVRWLAGHSYIEQRQAGLLSETIGDHSITRNINDVSNVEKSKARSLNSLARALV